MKKNENKTCPVWVGYILACPVRKLLQNPKKILNPHIKEGQTVMDIGSAMGFFSIPMAKMVGDSGKVICVDLQEKMFINLKKRAKKAGILMRITCQQSRADSFCIEKYVNTVDFAFASAVIHELDSPEINVKEIHSVLKNNAKFLVAEPKGHVSEENFQSTINLIEAQGFNLLFSKNEYGSRTALFEKN